MAKLTPLQKQKRTKKTLGFLVGVIVLTLVVLFSGLGDKAVPGGVGPVLTEKVTQEVARKLIREIHIPESFFNDGILSNLNSYIPLEAPLTFGREDPFSGLETNPINNDIEIINEEL